VADQVPRAQAAGGRVWAAVEQMQFTRAWEQFPLTRPFLRHTTQRFAEAGNPDTGLGPVSVNLTRSPAPRAGVVTRWPAAAAVTAVAVVLVPSGLVHEEMVILSYMPGTPLPHTHVRGAILIPLV
jgi:hypothetical protein